MTGCLRIIFFWYFIQCLADRQGRSFPTLCAHCAPSKDLIQPGASSPALLSLTSSTIRWHQRALKDVMPIRSRRGQQVSTKPHLKKTTLNSLHHSPKALVSTLTPCLVEKGDLKWQRKGMHQHPPIYDRHYFPGLISCISLPLKLVSQACLLNFEAQHAG